MAQFNVKDSNGNLLFSVESDTSTEANMLGTVARVGGTITSGGASSIWQTILNKITSLGTFDSVKEMLSEVGKKAKNAAGSNPASLEDVKKWMASNKGEFKSGAGHWWFGAMQVGDKASKIPESNIRITELDGVVVGLMKMKFGRNTTDASGLFDQQLVLVNTFTGSGDNIKAVKVGRCYLKGKDKKLASAESFFYGTDEQ